MTINELNIAPNESDPAAILECFNANFGNKLLTASVAHLHVFEHLEDGAKTFDQLRKVLELAERPAHVLVTALIALNLLKMGSDGLITLTESARLHLLPSSPFAIVDYIDLARQARGVLQLVESLRTNQPASAQYIKSHGIDSIMDVPAEAERLTECLAGRARNCAPVLAERCPLRDANLLVDIGGGTGLFAIAYLLRHERLRAIVLDLPKVLTVAQRYARQYGVSDRLECISTDMFRDPFPSNADAILLSNVLHDWGQVKCEQLLRKCRDALPVDGTLLIHDAMLNDSLDGPYHIALYSVVLFYLTEGRAYSELEYSNWLRRLGFEVYRAVPTRVHCSVVRAVKRDGPQ